jgi:large subunit ribosomal protein L15
MFRLDRLTSAGKKRKRVGRGGKLGGTSGKGHKGQKARSGGYVRPGFEGGQMPLFRRLPKRGFNNALFERESRVISIGRLDELFIDGATVTKTELIAAGALKLKKDAPESKQYIVKILGDGTLNKKLTVYADAFSETAKQAIERAGGVVHIEEEGRQK